MPVFFLNSALLAAAVMALVPLVIHLFHKRRARQDALSTMQFLAAASAANKSRLRLRHALILLLRVLAVLLVVAALARPAYRGAAFARRGTAPVNAVIVIDNSLSMAYEEAGRRHFDAGKATANAIIAGLPPGSRAALVVTGLGARGESLDREFTLSRAALAEAANGLEASAYGGDCAQGLRRAYAMLGREKASGADASSGEVYVISDLARHAWGALVAVKPPEGAVTIVVDAGTDANENFHIDETTPEWLTSPSPHIKLSATVASGTLAANRLVEVYLGGVKRAETIVALPANSKCRLEFDVPVLAASPERPEQGWVTLADDDPIRADNTRYFSVASARAIKCLVVGRPDAGAAGDTGFFLRNALEPAALRGATLAAVEYVDWQAFRAADLVGQDVLILADVPEIPAGVGHAIDDFASAGRGVVIFAGESAGGRDYDALLARDFGVTLGPKMSPAVDAGASLSAVAFDHPLLAAFAGGQNGNLAAAHFLKWRRLRDASGPGKAVILAQVWDGDPLILAAPIGAGRGVLLAFSPTREASDLPLRATFVPLVNEMARYAAGDKAARGAGASGSGFLVGSAVSLAVSPSPQTTPAEIATPLGGKAAEVSIAPGAASFVYRPFFPGNYLVKLPGSPAQAGFSANIAASESSSERVAAKEITDAIGGSVVVKELSDRPLRRAWAKTRGAREVFDLVLVAAILVLALEEFLANRFYRQAGG